MDKFTKIFNRNYKKPVSTDDEQVTKTCKKKEAKQVQVTKTCENKEAKHVQVTKTCENKGAKHEQVTKTCENEEAKHVLLTKTCENKAAKHEQVTKTCENKKTKHVLATKTCEMQVTKPTIKDKQKKTLDSKAKTPINIDQLRKIFESIVTTPINIDQLKKMFASIVKGANMDQMKQSFSWKAERPMKFPYTFCAKIRQFPYLFHYNNSWLYKYYLYGILASIPIFWKIHKLANSQANKDKWKEIRRKEREHLAHRWD